MSYARWQARNRSAQLLALAVGLRRLARKRGSKGNVFRRAEEEAERLSESVATRKEIRR